MTLKTNPAASEPAHKTDSATKNPVDGVRRSERGTGKEKKNLLQEE